MPTRPPTFRPSHLQPRAEQKRAHDVRRGSARARGYTSRWDKAAKLYLAEHPLCVGCDALGLIAAAALVDHVIPHKGDHELFWDRDNWQACCDWHHVTVKAQLEALFVKGAIASDQLKLDSATAVGLGGARALKGGKRWN